MEIVNTDKGTRYLNDDHSISVMLSTQSTGELVVDLESDPERLSEVFSDRLEAIERICELLSASSTEP